MRSYPIDTDRVTLISTGTVTPVAKWVELSDGSRRPDPQGRQDTDEHGRGLWRVEALTRPTRATSGTRALSSRS
ncbi:hypothetical protein Ae717Ps2_6723c [Pseudonocardia sp. Ae717_Ps2]|uniref:hypothetical protein n=1 Tax=Pseudonocardia sp. Ae717_Ps2 TaxID=1885573 RepID=UPI00094AC720|nr:hypothetical protein [Pseudonocardia sp. Ae717_Ps2]OLM28236.1 hypothetical protein Ae717Ps2_6723c [Pseudonocardia sp. Ae717_Ps2]